MAVTDIVLLLIMLVGLLRLHQGSCGTFGLTQFLWKQVCQNFSRIATFWLISFLSFRKGLIWIALATAVEIPPAVSLANFAPRLFLFIYLRCPRCLLF